MLKPVIYLLRLLNLAYYHLSTLSEKLVCHLSWTKELAGYFKTTPKKIIDIYQTKRQQTISLWGKKKRNTEAKIHSFYQETDYFIFRQNHYHRHKIYLDIALPLLLKKQGSFCEYGGGIGSVTKFLTKIFPGWQYTIVDLDCPVLKFARWRFKNNQNVSCATVTSDKLPLNKKYDVIVCLDVLEHVSNPFKVIKHLISNLKPRGWLYLNFIYEPRQENLVSAAKQRTQVLKYLSQKLQPIFTIDPQDHSMGYGLYIKPA